MNKIVADCSSNTISEEILTAYEETQYHDRQEFAAQQELLNSLTPTPNEIEQAEFEVKCLNLLLEVGLI